MQYKIHTAMIWDAFNEKCECPLCFIKQKTDASFVSQYLNEAVMVPQARIEVNKLGFCPHHLAALFEGENKLGLGLQINTYVDSFIKTLSAPQSEKDAKKLSAHIEKCVCDCVICRETDAIMQRYCATIAQMYGHEGGFEPLFNGSNGFCLSHFARLLDNCKYAKNTKEFLSALYELELKNLKTLNSDVEWFTLKFDYKNQDKPWRNSRDSIERAVKKLK